ncbi:MAG: SpoIIE family protein phosphatase [Planctomycetota bacterium]|jgi:serine phosphatase RsbU (regulator of sigma subunit)
MASKRRTVLWLHPVSDPEGESLRLEAGPYRIGRREEYEFRLRDNLVSRDHALLERRELRWFLSDTESKHGTFVNSRRLRPGQPTPVEPDDLLRFGPCAYRLALEVERPKTFTATGGAESPTTTVMRISPEDIGQLAYHRLELLMDGAAALDRMDGEEQLAAEAVRLTLEGTGFGRAMIIRAGKAEGPYEVIACRDSGNAQARAFEVSRTLIKAAAEGKVARLKMPLVSESVGKLGVHSAVCAPVLVDENVVAFLYLDSREGEPPAQQDAAGFCAAIARLCSHKLVDHRRKQVESMAAKLEADLRAAREVQECLAPTGQVVIGPFSCACRMEPGRFVAGDFFDVFDIGEGRVAICFGDVCGQGIGAAIVMSAVLAYLRAAIPAHCDPAAAARQVNRYIGQKSDTGRFVTLFVAIFDSGRMAMEYVDAGHGHWMVKRAGQAPEAPSASPSMALGFEPTKSYEVRTLELSVGDRLVLYSDGMVEHRDPDGEPFGVERLVEILAESGSPDEDVERAFAALEGFLEGRPPDDDTSLASLEVRAE